MIQTLDITNESEGKRKTICCKGQKFIVTLQKTQGERKKQNRNKINEKQTKRKASRSHTSVRTIHHTRTTV